jgi:transcriptional/translational regulatory protein YebC/TACO1
MFDRRGSVKVIASKEQEGHLIDIAIDNGAENAEESTSTDTEIEIQVWTVRAALLSK